MIELELAGEALVPVAGGIVSSQIPDTVRFSLSTSTDGEQFTEVYAADVALGYLDHVFELPEPVPAKFARATFASVNGKAAPAIGELKLIADASTAAFPEPFNLADEKLGWHVINESALELIDAYAPFVHAFLLDSGRPGAKVAELGGTGRVHDWTVSREFVRRSPKPVFLAGGLNPANVKVAIETVAPYGVDLCSGVRTNNKLDRLLVKQFMTQVQAAE